MIDSLEIVLEKDLPKGRPDRLKIMMVLDGVKKGGLVPLPPDYQTNPVGLYWRLDRALGTAVRTLMKEKGVTPFED